MHQEIQENEGEKKDHLLHNQTLTCHNTTIVTQPQNPPPTVTQPQNPPLNVLIQQPLPPINHPCIQLHHLTTTQEDLINGLSQNSANITQMVNRLCSSTLSRHSTLANTLE